MTPERVARLVARWVRLYTRGLPEPVARRRIEEIDADVHDHVAHERARGAADRSIALAIASRWVRGMPADASWRGRMIERHSTQEEGMQQRPSTTRSLVRVAVVTALVLMVPLVTMPFADGPGWSPFDFALAAVLLVGTGLLLEAAARNRHNVAVRAAAAAIGVAAIVLGEADDAPGLVLFGLVAIAGTIVLTIRPARRRQT